MKENVFDIIIYLFENYLDDEYGFVPDPEAIRTELLEAGFPQGEVNKAFEWLESLTQQQDINSAAPSFRVFSSEESAKLDTECRGLLIFLEQSGILTPTSREQVIDRLMAFRDDEISLENLKWVVLVILFSRPDEETAFARMEDLVYENMPTLFH
jgi:Smg protein